MRAGPNSAFKPPVKEENESELSILQKYALESVSLVPEQLELYNKIETEFDDCTEIMVDKIQLSERIRDTVDRHLKRLTAELEKIDDGDLLASAPAVSEITASTRAAFADTSASTPTPQHSK